MKRFTLLFGALLLGATSLLAQTNYTVTFSANYDMDSIQVNNTISGEVKMLYNPDNVITLQEIEKQNVAVATICSSSTNGKQHGGIERRNCFAIKSFVVFC